MVGHGGSSAGSYLADPASPIPSHCASIVATSTLRVKTLDNGSFKAASGHTIHATIRRGVRYGSYYGNGIDVSAYVHSVCVYTRGHTIHSYAEAKHTCPKVQLFSSSLSIGKL